VVLDSQKNRVFASEIKLQMGKDEYELTINPRFLVRGEYSINGLIHLPRVEVIDFIEDTALFTVLDNNSPMAIHGGVNYGSVFGNCYWS
jgi:hypothetical protein